MTRSGVVRGLTPLNQFMSASLRLERPLRSDAASPGDGKPLLLNTDFVWNVAYTIRVDESEDGANFVAGNAMPHVTSTMCRAASTTCDRLRVLYTPLSAAKAYRVSVTLTDALRPWVDAVGNDKIQPQVGVGLGVVYIDSGYTTFQLGWRYFFVTATFLIALAYTIVLFCGPASKDASGRRLTTPMEQRWVASLVILLVFFNDPFFAIAVSTPSLNASAFSAVTTVAFLTALLTYWLVHFHIAALQSEVGPHWHMTQTEMNNLGLCFWIPKVVFATLFFVVALSLYLWTRYQQLTDPGYSLMETQAAIADYFLGFVYAVAAVYLLYLFALLVLACRQWRRMRLGNRFFVLFTIAAAIILVIGIFLDAFTPLRIHTASFLVMYGAANFYVWALVFVYLPDKVSGVAGGRGDLGVAAASLPPADTTGVMGGGDDDLDVSADDVVMAAATGAAAPTRPVARPTTAVAGGDDAASGSGGGATSGVEVGGGTFVVEEEDGFGGGGVSVAAKPPPKPITSGKSD